MFFNNSERKGVTILIILILILLLLPRFIIHLISNENSPASKNNITRVYNSQTEQKRKSSILKNKKTNKQDLKSKSHIETNQKETSSTLKIKVRNKKNSQNKSYLETESYKNNLYNKNFKETYREDYNNDFNNDSKDNFKEDYKEGKGLKSKFLKKTYYKKRIYPINTRKYDSFKIELNSADTNSLIKIKGIGKYYASKIINYRQRLGGFIDLNQLEDINMQYLDLAVIKAHLYINKSLIIKKDLNALSFKEILKHPYLDYNDVVLIFQARKAYNKISVHLLLEKGILIKPKIERIQPYFK